MKGVSAKADRATRAAPQAPAGLGHAASVTDADETKLLIAEQDKPLAYLELSDEALGRFARYFLIATERALQREADRRELPLSVSTSMHAAIALYRVTAEMNAGEFRLEHDGVEWGGRMRGDWELTVRRRAAQGIEAATAGETGTGSTEGESPVPEGDAPNV